MMYLRQALIDNISNGEKSNPIEAYLRGRNLERSAEDNGMSTKAWVEKLFEQSAINIEDFEEFLFSELFYGKRKLIRVYKLENCRKYALPTDWHGGLALYSNGKTEDFSNILTSMPDKEHSAKIVAAKMQQNEEGELDNIKILFCYHIQLRHESDAVQDSSVYMPVELDFKMKRMVIKAWQRKYIATEADKSDALFERTLAILQTNFKVEWGNFGRQHKTVLYQMSKDLIDQVYNQIPAFQAVEDCYSCIKDFSELIIRKIPLNNMIIDSEGKSVLNPGVMEFEHEIKNVVEGLAINDYFFQKKFTDIWDMGIEAVVARIRFKDGEKVITSLRGENTTMPIFVTKTFMTLRERMNAQKRVETIWIARAREKGNLNLRYDASNNGYLEIWIRYGIKFREEDMKVALRIYDKYEQQITQNITGQIKMAVSQ